MTELTHSNVSAVGDQASFGSPNEKLIEEWNNTAGQRWLERHEKIDRQIAPFGRRAMDRADIQPGRHILDIGCGCGETTFDLARRVGNGGHVVGVDISALLIEAASKSALERGLSNIHFEVADVQTHLFPTGEFDIAFSRFGVMFFDDPDAAFRNIHAALRPGGRLAFVCWPAPSENLFVTIPKTAATRHVPLTGPSEPDAPGPFAFADINRVRGILSRSRFKDIEVDRIIEKVGGGSLDETAELLLQIGPLADLQVDDDTKRLIRADIQSALSQFERSGCVSLDAVAWLVTARC